MTIEQPTTLSANRESQLQRVWRFLTTPHASVLDAGERRRAQLLAVLTLVLLVPLTLGILSGPTSYTTFIALYITTVVSYILSRTQYHRIGALFFTYSFTSLAYLGLLLGTASSFGNTITSTAHIAIILSSALLPVRSFIVLVVLSVAATFGAPAYSQVQIDIASEFFRTSGTYLTISLVLIGTSIFRERVERERVADLSNVNRELQEITENLEQRVQTRTTELDDANRTTSRRAAQLQTIAELSQTIAKVQNPNEIFPTAAKLISERFGYYHVGIFLVDSHNESAILQATNSEGGFRMLERGHRLALGTGVVGFAAETGKPRIALDAGADAVFFNNPDLPDTRSEVALPLISGEKVVGVLDVQSTEALAFTDDDLQVLSTLANQVAIALDNARLLSEARASAKQVQEVYNEFVRTEWSRTAKSAEQPGFRYNTGRIEMLEEPLRDPDVASAVRSGKMVANQANGSEENRRSVAVPVKLRGEVIGVLQIESADSSKPWLENELSLMEAVAERAALAMENARLFQDARRRAAKERMISEASSRISGSLNIENILQTTASELERVLGGSEVLIQFKSKDSA